MSVILPFQQREGGATVDTLRHPFMADEAARLECKPSPGFAPLPAGRDSLLALLLFACVLGVGIVGFACGVLYMGGGL